MNKKNVFSLIIEGIIFRSRWILSVFYIGLIVAMIFYVISYGKVLLELMNSSQELSPNGIMLMILELVDMVMIANLIKMVNTGSYNSFISKDHGYENDNTSSGLIKVKMSTSLLNVAGILLLQSAVNIAKEDWQNIAKLAGIYITFAIGSYVLAVIEKITHPHPSQKKSESKKIQGFNKH